MISLKDQKITLVFRGYDTFGETIVIYTAGLAVFILLYNRTSKETNKSVKNEISKK